MTDEDSDLGTIGCTRVASRASIQMKKMEKRDLMHVWHWRSEAREDDSCSNFFLAKYSQHHFASVSFQATVGDGTINMVHMEEFVLHQGTISLELCR